MDSERKNTQTASSNSLDWTAMALAALVAIASTQRRESAHAFCPTPKTSRIETRIINLVPHEDTILKDMKLHD